MTFEEFNLNPAIIKAITACGYTVPTPIQEQSIPVVMQGNDLIAFALVVLRQAQGGSFVEVHVGTAESEKRPDPPAGHEGCRQQATPPQAGREG